MTRPAAGESPTARLGATIAAPPPPGVRIVLDARPLQEPQRAPLTATYLDGLLGAFDADPLDGESFALLLRSDLDDPTTRFDRLEVVGRRMLPPTHLLRSAALTVDTFVLSGASVGAAWRAGHGGAAGAVYHAAGGAIPLATGLPLVVTLLDLAPWELPAVYQRGPTARFGQRLRGRLLRDASAVIVGSEAVAASARRLLRLRRDRLRVVRLAPRPEFTFWPGGVIGPGPGAEDASSAMSAVAAEPVRSAAALEAARRVDHRAERERLGLPERYLVYTGRFDARQDLATLLHALARLATAGRPEALPGDVVWPPRVLLVGASPEDRASLARAAAREGVGDALAYAPSLADERLAVLVRGARAAILPSLSDAAGLPALEAIACGTPVIASAVGAL
ncbi:MAG TPA: glycosyltransferase, partial [Candidatus Limnocylindrales bacterium]|nr:glycosyltransferase [Candidatus Limnocylindrales bacterium]